MDPPVKKKRHRQQRYLARKNAASDGIEEVGAVAANDTTR